MRLYLAVFALLAAVHCEELINGDQVLRINAESEDHIQILKMLERDVDSGLDFWTHAVSTERPVDIRVPHSSLHAVKDFLKKNNIPFTVMINNVQELLVREREEMVRNAEIESKTKSFSFAAYHDLETIYNFMDTLANHSKLISKVKIGSTYENRSMYVLKFSTGGVKRPAIWIDAGIHAREWISHATAVWLADRIATDFKENRAPVPSILSKMDIYLMIVANPDGYVFTHRSSSPLYRFWCKSRSATSNPKCQGVDLNRNWDAEFGGTFILLFSLVATDSNDFALLNVPTFSLGPGASDDPCAEDYRGPSSQSEIEVKNIAKFIMSHGNFKSFMTLHSYMQFLMYPYGYIGIDAPDWPELHDVATKASKALNSWHGTVYKVGSIFHTIDQASGASVDWAYLRGIKYSFAFELRDTGEYGFLLPANQIVSTARETWFALRYIMKYVCDHPY
ncbi:carboxypeptidase A2-like isoform X1 [Onychostoma macrolepis]|uniref:carboxypeptidase A2-like isoform X1 n=1 Tax=Onychostoma macrolepis TaxID=369639 RepID=UPI0027297F78|nr:carboxypeptidase A2-like isoform X1 [Onychostoma macrolepis]